MNKELLLQDICARLPFGVRCSFGVDDAIYEITGINPSACGASEIQATHVKSGINGDFRLSSCKPYLFPLSSMTEEQIEELNKRYIVSIVGDSITIVRHSAGYWDNDIECDSNDYIWFINWLLKNHFDVNGLIPEGLAKDATGLNIY